MRGRTHTTVTNTGANRNQSQSWVSTPMCCASSRASQEATLSASQSISRSLSQESIAMEASGARGGTGGGGGGEGTGGGSGSGLRGWLWGQGIPTRSSGRVARGARLAARIEACAVCNTPCWAAVPAGAFVCKKASTTLRNPGKRNRILHCMQ